MKKFCFGIITTVLSFSSFAGAQAQFFVTATANSAASMDSNGKAGGACDLAHMIVNNQIRNQSNDQGQSVCWGEGFKQIGDTIKKVTTQTVTTNVIECSVQGTAQFECLKKAGDSQSITVYCKNGGFHTQEAMPCNFTCNGILSNIVIKSDTYNSTNGYTSVYGTATCTKK